MKVRVDLPQNHQDKHEFTDLLNLLDTIHDLIENQNFMNKPMSWVIELNDEELSVKRIEPAFEPDSPTPHLGLVH